MPKRGVSINVIKSSSLEVNLTLSVQLRKLTSPVLNKYLHCTRTSSPFTTQAVQRIFPLLQQNKGRFPLSLIRAPSLIQNVFVSQKIIGFKGRSVKEKVDWEEVGFANATGTLHTLEPTKKDNKSASWFVLSSILNRSSDVSNFSQWFLRFVLCLCF